MILAVKAEGAGYRDCGSVRDRDRLRKEHLERLGWRVHRLWSTSWFSDTDGELAKLHAAYNDAVLANPPAPPPPPDDLVPPLDDLAPPPDPVTDRASVAPSRRAPIALPAGDPVAARRLPSSGR
jgi:hypothetical protein